MCCWIIDIDNESGWKGEERDLMDPCCIHTQTNKSNWRAKCSSDCTRPLPAC